MAAPLATILVMSDPQFFFGGKDHLSDDDVARNNVSVLRAVRRIQDKISLKCAIICGDFTMGGLSQMRCFLNAYLKPYEGEINKDYYSGTVYMPGPIVPIPAPMNPSIDEDVYDDLLDASLKVKPVYLLLGNHDQWHWEYDEDLSPEAIVNKLYPKMKTVGTQFDIGDKYHIVLYDGISTCLGSKYPPLMDTLHWAKDNHRKVVVFTHNPDRTSDPWSDHSYDEYNKEYADNFAKAITQYPDTIAGVIGGHWHNKCGEMKKYYPRIDPTLETLYDGGIGTYKTFLLLRFYETSIEFLPLKARDYDGNITNIHSDKDIDINTQVDTWGWESLYTDY
ncbi:metallophosphoesterase family protein [Desulfoluna butyratoxydans]|uniref:Metallo-dependent phosphatase-like n=1 Tax=Desulfoluna butyratoxydans TaxID=231438 RepID=A0A4U8YZK7_9BACT|nr:metallophosphoesterase [Desulfoluna butyratoxydans]VFQ47263.1 metallo-dependent phosphatase-like [Desulfoluna butyratoxydans]